MMATELDSDTARLVKITEDLMVLYLRYTPPQARDAMEGFLRYKELPIDADWLHHEGAWQSALAAHFLITLQRPLEALPNWLQSHNNTNEARTAQEYFRDHYFKSTQGVR